MKYLRLYTKTFLIFSLFAGIGFSLLYPILIGLFLGQSGSAVLHLIFDVQQYVWTWSFLGGFIFSLVVVTLHIVRAKTIPSQGTTNLSPNQSRSIFLDTDTQSTYKLCLSSLMLITAKIVESNEQDRYIKTKTAMTFWSWGEVIEIKVSAIDDNKSQITVTSRPSLKTTLVDYGKNAENVEKICWHLKDKVNS